MRQDDSIYKLEAEGEEQANSRFKCIFALLLTKMHYHVKVYWQSEIISNLIEFTTFRCISIVTLYLYFHMVPREHRVPHHHCQVPLGWCGLNVLRHTQPEGIQVTKWTLSVVNWVGFVASLKALVLLAVSALSGEAAKIANCICSLLSDSFGKKYSDGVYNNDYQWFSH